MIRLTKLILLIFICHIWAEYGFVRPDVPLSPEPLLDGIDQLARISGTRLLVEHQKAQWILLSLGFSLLYSPTIPVTDDFETLFGMSAV